MASTEVATALITGISIGFAGISILASNIDLDRTHVKEVRFDIPIWTLEGTLFTGIYLILNIAFASSIYYLGSVEILSR
ncbi:hypothetical protein SAMN05216226_10692 [Halovenus aranensis]|uniref:Uncharacterized protein n=1 Tax=Halovenus aranensis TaxID=890420 RepID=A0A1G8VC21_9EURY|nr:hypothetical protein [Halovenus aranensis]SDJ62885.1 hypothetical protein SAMN05216226_10692 [Halovenus aranensis]